jgi:hypothetical protein
MSRGREKERKEKSMNIDLKRTHRQENFKIETRRADSKVDVAREEDNEKRQEETIDNIYTYIHSFNPRFALF